VIDVHCHLLPGIDDGPDSLEKSLELARFAVKHGITHSVVTPHIHPGRYRNDKARIEDVFLSYKEALLKEDIPLELGFAAEVRLCPEIPRLLDDADVPFYGEVDGEQIMLLELPHSHVPPGTNRLVEWLLAQKIRPLIAHPERNRGIMAEPGKIEPFRQLGCLFQLTAGSVAGHFGARAQYCAKKFLESGCVTVIASDAHNIKYRPPRLDEGRDAAAEIIGMENAQALVFDQPLRLVRSQFDSLI